MLFFVFFGMLFWHVVWVLCHLVQGFPNFGLQDDEKVKCKIETQTKMRNGENWGILCHAVILKDEWH